MSYVFSRTLLRTALLGTESHIWINQENIDNFLIRVETLFLSGAIGANGHLLD